MITRAAAGLAGRFVPARAGPAPAIAAAGAPPAPVIGCGAAVGVCGGRGVLRSAEQYRVVAAKGYSDERLASARATERFRAEGGSQLRLGLIIKPIEPRAAPVRWLITLDNGRGRCTRSNSRQQIACSRSFWYGTFKTALNTLEYP